MNKFIKEQLNKCKVADIPEFNDSTTTLLIKQKTKPNFNESGECIIEVEDYIIHPYPGFTLHDNWNSGIVPTDKQMKVIIVQDMGKMIKVKGVGINDNKAWGGWLPKKSCKIL